LRVEPPALVVGLDVVDPRLGELEVERQVGARHPIRVHGDPAGPAAGPAAVPAPEGGGPPVGRSGMAPAAPRRGGRGRGVAAGAGDSEVGGRVGRGPPTAGPAASTGSPTGSSSMLTSKVSGPSIVASGMPSASLSVYGRRVGVAAAT